MKLFIPNKYSLWMAGILFVPLALYSLFPITQFLYDDISHLELNPSYLAIESVSDIGNFSLQSSRPVSNVSLGLVKLIAGLDVSTHRLISAFLHGVVCLFFYLNLSFYFIQKNKKQGKEIALWTALLFGVLPITSETIVVSVFRWELLGSLFTLICAYLTQRLYYLSLSQYQRQNHWGLLILAWTLGTLSKESYWVFIPSMCLLFTVFSSAHSFKEVFTQKNKTFCVHLFKIQCLSGFVLYAFFKGPSDFVYDNYFGGSVLSLVQFFKYHTSALLEQLIKTSTGTGMALLRLTSRYSIGHGLPFWGSALVMGVVLAGFLYGFIKVRWMRLWIGIFLTGSLFYTFIPNLNVGSEHYFYFSAMGMIGLIVSLIFRIKPTSIIPTKQLCALLCLGLFSYYVYQLTTYLPVLKDRVSEAKYLVKVHPESPVGWGAVAAAYMEDPTTTPQVLAYVNKSLSIDAQYPRALTIKLQYLLEVKDLKNAKEVYQSVLAINMSKRERANIAYNYSRKLYEYGRCHEAREALLLSLKITPQNEFYQRTLSSFDKKIKEEPFRCSM